MATVYLVTNTAKTATITVQPGTLNGPLGVLSDSDINLHGTGALQWGGKLDENFLRLTENFACPEHSTVPGTPADAADLSLPGHGINNPIPGQLWFNTTSETMMVYTGTEWKQSGGTSFGATAPSASPSDGDLWYNIDYHAPGVGQLLVYNGGVWESVSEEYVQLDGDVAMTGFLTLNADPTSALHAATMQYVDNEISTLSGTLSSGYLPLSGGVGSIMTGPIVFDGGEQHITSHDGFGNFNIKAGTGLAADGYTDNNRFYETGSGASKVTLSYEATNGAVTLSAADIGTADAPITWHDMTWNQSGLNLNSHKITNVSNPTSAQDAATKSYVDTATAGIPAGTVPEVFTTLSPSSKAGDIAINGGKIYIALAAGGGANWKQVWPAVYT